MSDPSDRPVVVRLDAQAEVLEPANDLVYRTLLTASEHGPDLSLTWVRLDGRHAPLRSARADRVYHLLAGSAVFTVDGDVLPPVGQGDTVRIPRGAAYHLEGQVTYLVANAPALAPGDDLYLDPDHPSAS